MLSLARRGLTAVVVAALLSFAPIASSGALAAPSDTLTYTGGDGLITVSVQGTSLTATWPAVASTYRVHLWDQTAGSYVLLYETTNATSYSATIVRGHEYLAFFQTVDGAVYIDDWVYFTPPVPPAPNAPQNLTVTRLTTETGVVLNWTAPYNDAQNPATTYRVEMTAYGFIQTFTTTSLTMRFDGLAVGYNLAFAVTAIAADGQRSTPATATTTIAAVAPTAVPSATLSRDGSTITASWLPAAYDGGETASYSVTVYADNVAQSVTTLGGTSLVIVNDAPYGVAYHVVVSAVAAGFTGPSATSNTVTRPLPAPQPPTSVTATRLSAANGFDLAWTAPTDTLNPATSYSVDVTSSAGTTRYLTTVPSYRVTGLVVGREYIFAVSSIAADAQVSTSATTRVILGSTSPSAVTNLALTSSGADLSATWSASAYDGGAAPLSYAVSLFGDGQFISSNQVSSMSIAFAEIADYGVSYTAEVQPVTSDDLAGPTTTSNAVTRADAVPGAPVAWAEGYGYQNAMVYLTWDLAPSTGSPIQSLLVTLYDASGAVVQQWTLSSAYTSYSFANLPNDTEYTASVVATNLAGSSLESNRAPATTLALIPPAYTPAQLAQYGNYAGVTVSLSGTELTAHLDGIAAGTWVFGHAYSTPSPLGWTQVDASGFARWSIAGAGLTRGATHALAVQDSFGGLLGSATFDIAAAPSALARTGEDPLGWALVAAAMLALGAYVSARRARRTA